MSLLVVGVSHRTASVADLESLSLDRAGRVALGERLSRGEHVRESLLISTCNRTEVVADVETFHGGIAEITDALVAQTGVDRERLRDLLAVHYEDRAVAHLFTVASGLDSMAVGETQILGQVRSALGEAQQDGTAGPALNGLVQHALRVGKKAHSDTGIDAVSVSLVQAGLAHALERLHLDASATPTVVVVGAGAMAALAGTTASRAGLRVVVVNRSAAAASALAERIGGTARPLRELQGAIGEADIVLTATGAQGLVVTADTVAAGIEPGRRQVYLDLAVPHDVDPAVADIPGVERIDLDGLRDRLVVARTSPQVRAAEDLVVAEVAAYLTARAESSVAPTVAALRSAVAEVAEVELAQLRRRLPDLDPKAQAEVERTVHRIVEKLLHRPTAKVKAHATGGDGERYAAALRELFELDPRDAAVVSAPPSEWGDHS